MLDQERKRESHSWGDTGSIKKNEKKKVHLQTKTPYRGRNGRTWPLVPCGDERTGEECGCSFPSWGGRDTDVQLSEAGAWLDGSVFISWSCLAPARGMQDHSDTQDHSGTQDRSSQTRDGTRGPCGGSTGS